MLEAVSYDMDLERCAEKTVSCHVLLTADSLADLEQCAPKLIKYLKSCGWAVNSIKIPSLKDRPDTYGDLVHP